MQPVARSFNRSIKPENSGLTSKLFMAAGLGGMAYLTMQSMNINRNRQAYTQKGETFMSPLV